MTGLRDPEAAHIFPFAATSNKEKRQSIDTLLAFWGHEKFDSWRALCDDRGITESPKNMVCINEQMHSWWGAARFALKPITSTDKAVTVQFHWLRKSVYRPRNVIGNPLHRQDEIMSRLCGGNNNNVNEWGEEGAEGAGAMLAHRRSGLPIRTGQLFTIQAESPQYLPSMELLELQWNLLRVAALSGASGTVDDFNDGEDDDVNDEEYYEEYEYGTNGFI